MLFFFGKELFLGGTLTYIPTFTAPYNQWVTAHCLVENGQETLKCRVFHHPVSVMPASGSR